MPRFVDDREKVTIQAPWWAEKEICEIRRFNYGDRQFLAGKTLSMGIKPGQSDEEAIADIQIDRMNLAILERGIARWTDEEGKSIPVTSSAIKRLEEDDAAFILEEINKLNPRQRRPQAEQEAFRDGSGDGDQE
jgi:hypothetical protein